MFISSSCSGRVVPVSFCKTIETSDLRQARVGTNADLRRSLVASQVESSSTCARRKSHFFFEITQNLPGFGRVHVAQCSSGLKPLRHRASPPCAPTPSREKTKGYRFWVDSRNTFWNFFKSPCNPPPTTDPGPPSPLHRRPDEQRVTWTLYMTRWMHRLLSSAQSAGSIHSYTCGCVLSRRVHLCLSYLCADLRLVLVCISLHLVVVCISACLYLSLSASQLVCISATTVLPQSGQAFSLKMETERYPQKIFSVFGKLRFWRWVNPWVVGIVNMCSRYCQQFYRIYRIACSILAVTCTSSERCQSPTQKLHIWKRPFNSKSHLGRAANSAPEPPRATRSQPEPIRTVSLGKNHFFFVFSG